MSSIPVTPHASPSFLDCGAKRSRPFRPSRVIPAIFVLLACLVPTVPDVWTHGERIGNLGLDGSLWSALAGFCVAWVCLKMRQSWVAVIGFFGLCSMTLLGIVDSNCRGSDIVVGDILVFAAVPIGAAWEFTLSDSERRRFIRFLYALNWIALFGINCLLERHIIQRSRPGPRLFVYSEFICTWMLAVLMPLVYFDKELWRGRKPVIAQILLLGSVLLLMFTAQVSITRSVLLQTVGGLVFTLGGLVKFNKISLRWVLVIGIIALAFLSVVEMAQANRSLGFQSGGDGSKESLIKRFSRREIASEERITELHQLLSEYGPDMFVGRGLGSAFHSVTFDKDGLNYTAAPHIAIVTLLMKGGVAAFLLGIVLPAMLALRGVIFADSPEEYGVCVGVLLYLAYSSISGGWTFPQLFGYGFCLSRMVTLCQQSGLLKKFSSRGNGAVCAPAFQEAK